MSHHFPQPLVLHFIWHPDDKSIVLRLVYSIKEMLARDVDRPFSRELNIPVFFWNSIRKEVIKNDSPYVGVNNIIFLFVSRNTIAHNAWKVFFKGLSRNSKRFQIVPILIENGVHLSNDGENEIRIFEWKGKGWARKTLWLNVMVAHAVYSFVYAKDNDSRECHPVVLFLSHCKREALGEKVAQMVKDYVLKETPIKTFFDVTDILPGEKFPHRILKAVDTSTFVLFETDFYSSRHWCQEEICRAKRSKCPILAIDFRNCFEDRVFPGCSNVPCFHIRHDILEQTSTNKEVEILRILEAALVETIRCHYNWSRLRGLQRNKCIPSSAELLVRPPELSDLPRFSKKSTGCHLAYYPEPPVFLEESDWYPTGLFEARTPLWNKGNADEFRGMSCGISVSTPDNKEFGDMLQIGHTPDSLHRLIQDISRHLLVRKTKLLFGGDLRTKEKSGFTRFILDEAKALRERGIKCFPKIENHLPWLSSTDIDDLNRFKADNDSVLSIKLYHRPSSSKALEEQYVQAITLSNMRKKLTSRSAICICAGGKRFGFKGAMPGVLEEILLMIKSNKPLYLLGGFGGVVQDVVHAISRKDRPESLTEKWQLKHSAEYGEMLRFLKQYGSPVCYADILGELQRCSIKDLAKRAGLSCSEYSRLIHSPFVDECLFLILRGIRNVKKSTKGNKS